MTVFDLTFIQTLRNSRLLALAISLKQLYLPSVGSRRRIQDGGDVSRGFFLSNIGARVECHGQVHGEENQSWKQHKEERSCPTVSSAGLLLSEPAKFCPFPGEAGRCRTNPKFFFVLNLNPFRSIRD